MRRQGLEGIEKTTGIDIAGKNDPLDRTPRYDRILPENGWLVAITLLIMVLPALFCVSCAGLFYRKRLYKNYDIAGRSLGLDTLRQWLDDLGMSFF